eukprot:gene19804-21744_t
MEKQPANKKARLTIKDFFAKEACPVGEGREQSASVDFGCSEEQHEDKRQDSESEKINEASFSRTADEHEHDYPYCWNAEQSSYFSKTYSWLLFNKGKLGCSSCKSMKNLGVYSDKSIHIASEWTECKVGVVGEKRVAQKSLRKKIAKHEQSKAHNELVKVLKAREENSIKTSTVKDLIDLQEKNGVNLGSTLQSRFSCKEMVNCIAESMRAKICERIKAEERKIAIITDESTTISKKSCVIIYIRSVVCDDKPVNVFLDICELPGQDAQSICDCIVNTLAKYSFDKEYLVKNLIVFTCDGASVMLGVKSDVGKRLKDQFPAIVIWHCMNHRLELAVSDAVKSINGFYTLESFFNKIYSTYSFSAKMQRELKEIASKLDVELRKIGKVFTIRWAASTYRAVYALWCSFPALHEHFSTLAKDDSIDSVKRATYSGIAKKLAISVVEANRYLKYTINSLEKIKVSISEGKYSFDQTVGSDVVFKGVPLGNYQSRGSYCSFNKPQLLQALIDNIKARMLDVNNEEALKQLEIFIPERWPSDVDAPWLQGEQQLIELCRRFHVSNDGQGLIMAFREYVSDPRKTPRCIGNVIQEILYTIPISSSEAERGFSQMNLVCTPARSALAVKTLSSLIFISINGPPPNLWNAQDAVARWLLSHRSALAPERKKRVVKKIEDLNSLELIFT